MRIYNYIVQILKDGSFSKAAENLYMSQPSLSRAIINFEKKIGYDVLVREQPIHLTEQGKLILNYLEEVNQLELELFRKLRNFSCHAFNQLDTGIISWNVPSFLPRVFPEFRKQHIDIDLRLIIKDSVSMELALGNDELDIAIFNGPVTNPNIHTETLYTTNIAMIAHADLFTGCDLESLPNIIDSENIRALPSYGFLLLRENTRMGKICRDILYDLKIDKDPVIFDVDNMNSAIEFVNARTGYSFVPEYLISHQILDTTAMKVFSLRQNYSLKLVLAYKKDNLNPNKLIFRQFVLDFFKKEIEKGQPPLY